MFARSLIAFCLIVLVPPVFAQEPPGSDPVLGTQQKISVWSYNKAFAARFNLPEIAEEGLPPDVWAMEFRLTKNTHDGAPYACIFNVYVDNKLKILYPEGEVGSVETLRMEKPAQPAKMPNTEDRLFHGEQSSKYTMKASFFSHSQQSSLGGSVTYRAYRKYFLSDIAYLSFSIGTCSSVGDPRQYKTFLWIEKEGGRDYLQWTKFDPKDFFEFPVPKEFIKRFYPHARVAAEKNAAYFSAEDKARREQRGRESKRATQK